MQVNFFAFNQAQKCCIVLILSEQIGSQGGFICCKINAQEVNDWHTDTHSPVPHLFIAKCWTKTVNEARHTDKQTDSLTLLANVHKGQLQVDKEPFNSCMYLSQLKKASQ